MNSLAFAAAALDTGSKSHWGLEDLRGGS